jgi:hypothetical protein
MTIHATTTLIPAAIFPNATCATALIDRTVHHADVIAIDGESYRRREAEADKKARRGSRGKKAAA